MDAEAALTLLAIIVGPVAAVLITLFHQQRREQRERRLQIVRMLMATRHLPSDPNYSLAINLIPVEFHGDKGVLEAFKAYSKEIRKEPRRDEHGVELDNLELRTAQIKLVSAVLRSIGIAASEADLAIEAYASRGMMARDELWLRSLDAQIRTANALERSLPETEN